MLTWFVKVSCFNISSQQHWEARRGKIANSELLLLFPLLAVYFFPLLPSTLILFVWSRPSGVFLLYIFNANFSPSVILRVEVSLTLVCIRQFIPAPLLIFAIFNTIFRIFLHALRRRRCALVSRENLCIFRKISMKFSVAKNKKKKKRLLPSTELIILHILISRCFLFYF